VSAVRNRILRLLPEERHAETRALQQRKAAVALFHMLAQLM
jgi:hypothetical protein